MLIFDVQATDAVREGILKELTALVDGSGGGVVETVPFGIRTLAMELKGRRRGDYRILRFQTAGDVLQKMDRMLRLKEEVLRFLITKYYPPKPKKEKRKKLQKPEIAGAETEGEKADGKSEQSAADRQPDAPAGA
ncbi:MAG: 30S ribosomal protein S6 [Candidatus Lindowbacteria bacterium RIFCSPLOWO2_02_FULL_62_12]|nr:MAG: 30S ribosomal protein S6 [Candidatus Lindowbacteria bacterium RIFCSPLOWO2_02_FULL_62_12]